MIKPSSSPVGLNLAAASSYNLNVDECLSGYRDTTVTAANVQIYNHDSNCLVKLTTFGYDGETYTPKTGETFDTWLAGDIATFENGDQSIEVTVEVIAQITTPVNSSDTVEYEFRQSAAGSGETLTAAPTSSLMAVMVKRYD